MCNTQKFFVTVYIFLRMQEILHNDVHILKYSLNIIKIIKFRDDYTSRAGTLKVEAMSTLFLVIKPDGKPCEYKRIILKYCIGERERERDPEGVEWINFCSH